MKPSGKERDNDVQSQSRTKQHELKRRPDRHGTIRDRQGLPVDDSNGASTIRTVTPEEVVSPEILKTSPKDELSSSPPARLFRKESNPRPRDHSGSVSNTDEENTIESRRRKAKIRGASKDDITSDASPGSFITKTRRRLGSITTNVPLSSKTDDSTGSIGFPSVTHLAPSQENSEMRRIPRTPRRDFSPDRAHAYIAGGLRSPAWLTTDSTKIFQLMKSTCGRMHGILFFRPMHSQAWASGWCAINVAPGSLVYRIKGDVVQTKTLIPDLRGCNVRTHYDAESQNAYLSILIAETGTGYQLRPTVAETFDSWLAALLCWQVLRPRGVHNKMTKPQSVAITERRPVGQRRFSDVGNQKGTAIIKVGKMYLWDGPLPSGSQTLIQQRSKTSSTNDEASPWRRVSCTLHENGHFRLLEEADVRVISVTALSELSRCAVQRVDESVLKTAHCIAIYPQYTAYNTKAKQKRPMILCPESRVAFEAWFVLLRALTVPELYGPAHQTTAGQSEERPVSNSSQGSAASGMFRIERSLTVRITEAKVSYKLQDNEQYDTAKSRRKSSKPGQFLADVYADIACGQEVRARTAIKSCSASVFWADEFVLRDLPSALTRIAVIIRMVNPGEREWTMIANGPYDIIADPGNLSGIGGIEISSHDSVLGSVEVELDELEHQGTIEKWWTVVDNNDNFVGQMLMKVGLSETVVLLQDEYSELSSTLHNFSNSLTTQLAQPLGQELKQLSDILLDFFQSSGNVNEWICNLIEEEIDGIYRETPPMRMRFSGRLQSNDSYEAAQQRELLVRDLSRSATMEANLLFRGNSLVTKALDAHMRRLGSDYLNDVLGAKLRTIVDRDPDCEVDPVRVKSPEQLSKNWANLIFLTNSLWKSISTSASQCPAGLRILFKHIRSCAEDRYGSFIRTVKYTSVSGFLFLRFFCPAILNPKLFGLLPDHPPDQAKRTFTLIAKSLNVLANMAKFGTKEPWMEPMNKFLTASAQEFKTFTDEICAVNSSQLSSSTIEPQYAAPNQIKGRLSAGSRDGLPSLPYLLDTSRLLADLVELWVRHAPENVPGTKVEEPVKTFHELCTDLHRRTKDSMSAAELAEKPDTRLEPKWQQMLTEQQRRRNPFEEGFFRPLPDSDLTALPQTSESALNEHHADVLGDFSTPSSSASAAWDRKVPYPHRTGENKALTSSTNSSNASLIDESRSRPLPGSRDGPKKNRLLGLMGSSGRRKGRGTDSADDDDDEP